MNLQELQNYVNGKSKEEVDELLKTLDYDKTKYQLITDKDKLAGVTFTFTSDYKKTMLEAITKPFDDFSLDFALKPTVYMKIDTLLNENFSCVNCMEDEVYASVGALLRGTQKELRYIFQFSNDEVERFVIVNKRNGELIKGSYEKMDRNDNYIRKFDFVEYALDELTEKMKIPRNYAARLLNTQLLFYFKDEYTPTNALEFKENIDLEEIRSKTYENVKEMLMQIPFQDDYYERGVRGELKSQNFDDIYHCLLSLSHYNITFLPRIVFDKTQEFDVRRTKFLILYLMQDMIRKNMESIEMYRLFVEELPRRSIALVAFTTDMSLEVLRFILEKGDEKDLEIFLNNNWIYDHQKKTFRKKQLPFLLVRDLYFVIRGLQKEKEQKAEDITEEDAAEDIVEVEEPCQPN